MQVIKCILKYNLSEIFLFFKKEQKITLFEYKGALLLDNISLIT